MDIEACLSAESKRLQDEHERFADSLRLLKKNLEDKYNNKM